MQLPHAMEPQLHAQVGTEVPVNHFHCTLYQVSLLDIFNCGLLIKFKVFYNKFSIVHAE